MRKFILTMVATAMLPVALQATPADGSETDVEIFEQLDLFGRVFERVRREYIEDVSSEDLIEKAIEGMLSSLDPHSAFLPPQDAARMRTQTSGEFGGLGITVTMEEGLVKVISPIDGTPAARAGIQSGDMISHIDDQSVRDLTLEEAVDRMRGPKGSSVEIQILRKGAAEPLAFTLERATIEVPAVASQIVEGAAVLRIAQFNAKTTRDLHAEMEKMVTEAGGIDALSGVIIDLRNNPGGLLTESISVSDAFLDEGEIVSIRGRNDDDETSWSAARGDIAKGKPIIVLINGGSASAAEIVAGALKDQGRALVIGTTSFGKGSVQTVIPLGPELAMKLTTARYYTPSGRSIQALGITPDIEVSAMPAPVAEDRPALRGEADLPGRLDNKGGTDAKSQEASDKESDAQGEIALRQIDPQLAYALDLLKGLSILRAP